MGKVKAWKMDMEETILDCITEAVVSECDHVTELYKKVTDAITDTYIKEHQSDLIEQYVMSNGTNIGAIICKKDKITLDIYRRVW